MDREQYLRWWNVTFPLDRLWRKKYNIPWGSEKHHEITFESQVLDFIEDELFKKIETSKSIDIEEEIKRAKKELNQLNKNT